MTIALGVSLNSSSSTLLPVKIWEINETRDLLHTWVWNDILLHCNNGSDSYIFVFLITDELLKGEHTNRPLHCCSELLGSKNHSQAK